VRPALLFAAGALMVAATSAGCSPPGSGQARVLMEQPIASASDAIFNAVIYTNGNLAASPTSDGDWDKLAQQARELQEAAVTLAQLAPRDNPGLWTRQANAMGEASAQVGSAVESRSLNGVLEAGSRLYGTCTSCHAVYAPDF